MEDSRSSKKPLTGSEIEEDKFPGSMTKKLPSSSSSKPPLGPPVPLLPKKPNNNSDPSLLPPPPATIEAAVTDNNSEQDKNSVALNETKNQHEPPKVSDPSEATKLKRVMSNRISAHRSRLRKLEHVANLERQCIQLKNQISVLEPQVEAFGNLKHMLMLEQSVLKQRVEALENQRFLKQGEIERNQAEVYRLREIEKQQKEAEAAQAMMAFANWDTLPNNINQQILLHNNITPQGFQNMAGTSSGMEVDEQAMNLMNSDASMNELDAIVNPPKLSDDDDNNNNKASSELRFYF